MVVDDAVGEREMGNPPRVRAFVELPDVTEGSRTGVRVSMRGNAVAEARADAAPEDNGAFTSAACPRTGS
jgi:hypothetical protein